MDIISCYLVPNFIAFHSIIVSIFHFIGLMRRVFANGLGDQGSILGQVIPKAKKMVLDSVLLSTQHYKVWIKGKVAPSPTPWCSNY